MRDPLELVGAPLFGGGLLAEHLERQIRGQIGREYAKLVSLRRNVSKLQLRRRFENARFPPPVTLTPAAALIVLDEPLVDGRRVAEHHSLIEGEPDYLAYAPRRVMPDRLPVAMIMDSSLVMTVRFDDENLPFVAALVQAELALILGEVARQRELLERFDHNLSETVRRLVAEEWPKLTG